MLNITHYERNTIKTTVRYHLTLVRVAINKKCTNSKWWSGCGEKGTFLNCSWECKLIQSLWRTVWMLLKKLEIELPYGPTIPLLGLYHEKSIIGKKHMYPPFSLQQPRCLSTDECLKKCGTYIQWNITQP